MSAIFGVYYLDNRPASIEVGSAMLEKLSVYKADNVGTWYGDNVLLGCQAQYITAESEKEILPYFEDESGLAITADAIIDNRAELFQLLNVPGYERTDITDSMLILLAYKKWGDKCTDYLIGDFAFAIWNSKDKTLFCARDHVGKRTFYYYHSSRMFAFCTLMKPLLVIDEIDRALNEEWIADFLSLDGVAHEFESDSTIYKKIQQLPPAHCINMTQKGLIKTRYWFPLQKQELHLKSDEEYDSAFREVFSEAVKCRLRSRGPVGIMLSGGLDSGAIACIAARELAHSGKRLKAYSHLPLEGYENWLPERLIADESEYIRAICEHAQNIDLTCCRSEGKHSAEGISRFLSILEHPYKTVENLYWTDDIASTAASHGCSVLLDGQLGNCTISYGDFFTHIITLYRKKKWIRMLKEIRGYSSIHNLALFPFGKVVARALLPHWALKLLNKTESSDNDLKTSLMVNPDFALRWKSKERLMHDGYGISTTKKCDLSEVRRLITHPAAFSHLGSMETKMSLEHALAKRDPTRDKRVIEFCMSLPGDQYVRNGQERFLIRRSMAGILPDMVRLNTTVRGMQSADWIQRLLPVWSEIRKEIELLLEDEHIREYFNVSVLKQILTKYGDLPDHRTRGLEMRMLLICLNFGYFLKEINKVS